MNTNLPSHPIPHITLDTYTVQILTTEKYMAHGSFDLDWAGDSNHRRSINSMGLFFAGGPIVYQSRCQLTLSLISTNADLTAATEAGRLALYLRSMLDDLDIS